MIDPDYYLFADLSITEIEGPADFYYEENYDCETSYKDWKFYIEQMDRDLQDSAEADDLGDILVELESPDDLMDW